MTNMMMPPNTMSLETCSYANAQIQIVESKMQDCANGSAPHPLMEFVRDVTAQVCLILDSINEAKFSPKGVEIILPSLTTLGQQMDRCVAELKAANWWTRFMWAKVITNFEQAADRVDSVVETMRLSKSKTFIDHIKSVLDEKAMMA